MMENRAKFLCWSGGLDSTFLLFYYLKKNIDIQTYALDADQFAGNEGQKETRYEIINYLKDEYDYSWKHEEIGFKLPIVTPDSFPINYKNDPFTIQTAIIFSAILTVPANRNIVFGFINSDRIWYSWSVFDYIITSSLCLMCKEEVKVENPLQNRTKLDLIKELSLEDPLLYDLCFSCQDANNKTIPCGICSSCMLKSEMEMLI